jgi:hypothetical protein
VVWGLGEKIPRLPASDGIAFFGAILLKGLGYGLDLQFVLFPQPGDDFSKMPSRLAAWLV